MKLFIYILYSTFFWIVSCKSGITESEAKHFDPRAVQLSNLALKISQNMNECNKDSIYRSISLLQKAIKIDSTYYLAYGNEAQMFCKLKKYNEAIEVLNHFLNSSHNYVELLSYKGFIFEKIGNRDSAKIIYQQAINEYQRILKTDSLNVSYKLNLAALYFFTDGNNRAKMEYEKISKSYPSNEQVKAMKEFFYFFKRNEFIKNLFYDCD